MQLPKKYNRVKTEEKWKEYWQKEGIYKFEYDPKKPLYIVDTPPPYVSAEHLHSGHIMSYAQAEFIVRFKRMQGCNVFYPMGFDDNGLPTERFVEQKYKVDKTKIKKSEFIKLCLKETEIGARTYKKLWNNLGISVDWSKTYSTISPLAVRISQWSLLDLYKKGVLYRTEDPILWCPFCQTAVAQADLEDQEIETTLNYIRFKGPVDKELVIATTRPELLPACVAMYVHPQDKRYQSLIDQEVQVPLFNQRVVVRASGRVDPEFGTGLMMVCTWGDQEDVAKWREDGLSVRLALNRDGTLNESARPYAGLSLEKAREQILADLKKEGLLLRQEKLTHTLNVHERCGTPTEFILSKQWFIKIAELKEKWLELGKKLNWYPQYRRSDYETWVNSLKWDWCISRQRYYGVPFPIWYCQGCEEPIFAREKDLPVNPLEDKPPASKCPLCGHKEFVPEEDVLDTWATSSCTPFLLRELVENKKAKKALFPTTLRPNAFEIIRTWDFYSIVKSYYHFGKLPFRDIMISGHGLDEKGRKISKRLGNYLPSDELLAKYGADPIRYWATGATLGQNLRFQPREIEKGKKTAIKLWNAARFLTMYIDDFRLNQEEPALELPDVWLINLLNQAIQKVTTAFENYTYAKAKDTIDNFFWSTFADYYLEFVKHRLAGEDRKSKSAAIFTLKRVFLDILKMYAPILPFVTEELYQNLFAKFEKQKSIHLSPWPKPLELRQKIDLADFDKALIAIDEIRKYKSEQGLSLAAEIENYQLQAQPNLAKHGDFVRAVMRIKDLSTR